MYFPDTQACQAPNSLQPASQAEIMRGVKMLGRMESRVRKARQAFNCLLYRNDLNTNGWPLATHGGTPSSTILGCPNPPDFSGLSAPGGPAGGINALELQYWPTTVVTLPDPQGLPPNGMQTYPQPPAPVMLPLTTQQHTLQAQQLTQAAAAATNPVQTPAPTFPTTGNLCLDIMLNYVDPSQVSASQLFQCAQKGYSGNRDGSKLTPAMTTWRAQNFSRLPKIADQPNVPQYDQGTMAGMGDWNGGSFLQGIIAAVGLGASAVYLFNQARKMGYF